METAQFTLWGSQCQQMIAHCIATSGILTPIWSMAKFYLRVLQQCPAYLNW